MFHVPERCHPPLMSPAKRRTRKISALQLWFERIMALVALTNLILVFFDLSYVPWRNLYIRVLPESWYRQYDRLKGIEPHRKTARYLDLVNKLKQQVSETGVRSPRVQPLLRELRQQSVEIIEENPFQLADKIGALEKIKNRMRDRLDEESAKDAFRDFWSQDRLTPSPAWSEEIEFFDEQIRPLFEVNYFRHIGENGEFIDRFWWIDLPFVALFGFEFLVRTWFISRRHVGLRWQDAMLWRWYDLLLLSPLWRWLRVIPTTARGHHARFINLNSIRYQVSRGIVASFAAELTEIVVVRIIDQLQDSVKKGEITEWLFSSKPQWRYIDLNNVNEVEAIASRVINLTVYNVFPKIRPDLEAITRHAIDSTLTSSSVYRNFQRVPGWEQWSDRLTEQLVANLLQSLYSGLTASLQDPVAAQLNERLARNFTQVFGEEIRQQTDMQEVRELLSVLLEEIKINYVKRTFNEDFEQIVQETQQLYELARESSESNHRHDRGDRLN
mgnify:CR=1 FL=1